MSSQTYRVDRRGRRPGADAGRGRALGGHLPAPGRRPRARGADADPLQQQHRADDREGPAAGRLRLRLRHRRLPRPLGLRRRVLPLPQRGRGRLRHPGVGRRPGLVQRPHRHRRRLLRGHHPAASRAAGQPLPQVHGAAGDLRRLPRRAGLPGRGPAAERGHDLGHAHPRAHRPGHRLPQLDRGLPLAAPGRHRYRRRPAAAVLEGLDRPSGLRRLLGGHGRRAEVGPRPGAGLQHGRLVRPLRQPDLLQLQRTAAVRRLRGGAPQPAHRRPLAPLPEHLHAHRRHRLRRELPGGPGAGGAALVRPLAQGPGQRRRPGAAPAPVRHGRQRVAGRARVASGAHRLAGTGTCTPGAGPTRSSATAPWPGRRRGTSPRTSSSTTPSTRCRPWAATTAARPTSCPGAPTTSGPWRCGGTCSSTPARCWRRTWR